MKQVFLNARPVCTLTRTNTTGNPNSAVVSVSASIHDSPTLANDLKIRMTGVCEHNDIIMEAVPTEVSRHRCKNQITTGVKA